MNTTTNPAEVQQANDLDFFEPIILHYIKKTLIAEAHVQETDVRALCGEEWVADYTDVEAAFERRGRGKTVTCPLCADVYSGLPATR